MSWKDAFLVIMMVLAVTVTASVIGYRVYFSFTHDSFTQMQLLKKFWKLDLIMLAVDLSAWLYVKYHDRK